MTSEGHGEENERMQVNFVCSGMDTFFLPLHQADFAGFVADFVFQWLIVPHKSWYKSPSGMEEGNSNFPGRQNTACSTSASTHN